MLIIVAKLSDSCSGMLWVTDNVFLGGICMIYTVRVGVARTFAPRWDLFDLVDITCLTGWDLYDLVMFAECDLYDLRGLGNIYLICMIYVVDKKSCYVDTQL